MVDAEGVGVSILDQVVQGGVFFALPVFLISLVLFIQGSKQIPLTVGLGGVFVGFGLSGQLYSEVVDFDLPVTEQQFRIIAAVLIAGVLPISTINFKKLNFIKSTKKRLYYMIRFFFLHVKNSIKFAPLTMVP